MLKPMKDIKSKNGYILILTMLMIAGITAIVTYIFNRGMVQASLASTIIAREKAKALALGGLQVALAQLSYKKPKKQEEHKGHKQPAAPDALQASRQNPAQEATKELLTTILPALNRFQIFELHEPLDGIDGALSICIMSEEGKINLNEIFDFKTQKFKDEGKPTGDWKKILQELCKKIDEATKGQDLFSALSAVLKKQDGAKFDDVTELLLAKQFEVFKNTIYYEPPQEKFKQKKRPLYLTDIFTVDSGTSTIDPWLFSDSLLALLNIKRAQLGDLVARSKEITNWLQKFKLVTNWKTDWAVFLKPIYEKDFAQLPKLFDTILISSAEPKTFSVRVHAQVQSVEQQLFAIVQRIGHSQNGEIVYAGKIKKLYWL